MPPNLGVKYICFKCGSKFYDLKRPVPLCPKCGADQRDSPPPAPPVVERKRVRAKTPSDGEASPAADPEVAALEDDEEEEPEGAAVAGEELDEEP
jgi:uncharacterized protein (TIGR02300 family)